AARPAGGLGRAPLTRGPREGASVVEAELIAFAKERLAAHKVPKSVQLVDELAKNPSGKLLKRELRERFGGTGSAIGRD
ncbi:MAG: AMP-binding enzyme, partial [Solirubrobacteraceae bacterium]